MSDSPDGLGSSLASRQDLSREGSSFVSAIAREIGGERSSTGTGGSGGGSPGARQKREAPSSRQAARPEAPLEEEKKKQRRRNEKKRIGHLTPPPFARDADLTIELVPETSFFSNVRSERPESEWELIRNAVYRRAGYRCEICGGQGPDHPVEAHEKWHYDDVRCVQELLGMIALCPSCHRVKHMGKARIDGRFEEARAHLAEVNGWSGQLADAYIEFAFQQWRERSRQEWKLDLSRIEGESYRRWLRHARRKEERRRRGGR